MIEILIAISVLVVILAGLAKLATVQIRNSTFSQNQNQSSKLAQQAVEWVRSQRDADWVVFATHTGNFCLNSLSWTTGICAANDYSLESKFKRQASISDNSSPAGSNNSRQVTVTVSWRDSSGTHTVTSETTLTNWK